MGGRATPAAQILLPLGLSLAFVAGVCALGPWWSVYEFDTDEGLNLMKAMLVARGHALYAEVWSDQPPVLTYLLAPLFKAGLDPVAAARAVILGFSALLLATLFRLVARRAGPWGGAVAVLVLAADGTYLVHSVSVLINLPALALALVALDLADGGPDGRKGRGRRWASALVFALALGTKMVVGVLAPVILALVWARPGGGWRGAAVWLAVAAAGFLAVASLAGGDFLDQLVAPHLDARTMGAVAQLGGVVVFIVLAIPHGPLWLLGLAGAVLAFAQDRRGLGLPLLWLALDLAAFVDHRPLWPHHYLMMMVPAAWLAGYLGAVLRDLTVRRRLQDLPVGLLAAVALAGGLWLGAGDLDRVRARFAAAPDPADLAALAAVEKYRDPGRPDAGWLVTDRPIDALRAGIPVPPPVAVFSQKRVQTGHLTEDEIIAVLRDYAPAQVSLRRFPVGPRVAAELDRAYDLVAATETRRHYVRRVR